MLFDEPAFRFNLDRKVAPNGILIASQIYIHDQIRELVITVSFSLDKVVINEISIKDDATRIDETSVNVYSILVKDVVKSIFVKKLSRKNLNNVERLTFSTKNENNTDRLEAQESCSNILLIGCSNCIRLYDLNDQSKLFTLTTQAPVTVFAEERSLNTSHGMTKSSGLTIFAGPQRIYMMKFEPILGFNGNKSQFVAELSSQRSVDDNVTCMFQKSLNTTDILVTGSSEGLIRIYQLDLFEENIQACLLSIKESGPVKSLVYIDTRDENDQEDSDVVSRGAINNYEKKRESFSLPKLDKIESTSGKTDAQQQIKAQRESNFAFVLESGFIGAYRLIIRQTGSSSLLENILKERLWRHRCQSSPCASIMLDTNGDGFEELVIGFRNSRIESRHPLTGQLIDASRCFKSEELVYLSKGLMGNNSREILLESNLSGLNDCSLFACSSSGLLIGFTSINSKPNRPLLGYVFPSRGQNSDTKSVFEKVNTSNKPDEYVDIGTSRQQFEETKPRPCESKQSLELLQQLSMLMNGQSNLEYKAHLLFMDSIYQGIESKLNNVYPKTLDISYSWDLDLESVHLRLRIRLVMSAFDSLKLMKLEDESENLISSRYLLIDLSETTSKITTRQTKEEKMTHLAIVLLRPKHNKACELKLHLFYEANDERAGEIIPSCSRVFCCLIKVPRYSLFGISQNPKDVIKFLANKEKCLRIFFRQTLCDNDINGNIEQILDWIDRNFLCFRFGQLIQSEWSSGLNLRNSIPRDNRADTTTRQKSSDGGEKETSSITSWKRSDKLLFDSNVQGVANKTNELVLYILNWRSNFDLEPSNSIIDVEVTEKLPSNNQDATKKSKEPACVSEAQSILKIVISRSTGELKIESCDFELLADIADSLMDEQVFWPKVSLGSLKKSGLFECHLEPLMEELEKVREQLRQINETEKRIQSEIYESANYAKDLLEQLAIGIDLNEFSTSKELLNELFMMLTSSQTSARAHSINNKSHRELEKRIRHLECKLNYLSGENLD